MTRQLPFPALGLFHGSLAVPYLRPILLGPLSYLSAAYFYRVVPANDVAPNVTDGARRMVNGSEISRVVFKALALNRIYDRGYRDLVIGAVGGSMFTGPADT
jgi:hypothetical protein